MKKFTAINILLLLCLTSPWHPVAAAGNSSINWLDWSPGLFRHADEEQRFILLDLEAVWCHWCHVMDAETYVDPEVVALLGEHYLAVKVDHDARPDLANRYRAWGWPATIIFDGQGREIVKRAGYINPRAMARLLQAVVDDPSPERMVSTELAADAGPRSLPEPLRQILHERHKRSYDRQQGGLKLVRKFIDRDSVEYALWLAARGDTEEAARAEQTLTAAMALIDPAWGGFFQYSTRGNWQNPHFEKIIRVQASYLRLYAQAWAYSHQPAYASAMQETGRYVDNFLTSPEGAFYVSQDADLVQGEHAAEYFALDDAERRKLGVPRIDKNRYAMENGWMIEALATRYEASGEAASLAAALRAAGWVIENLGYPAGGFVHGSNSRKQVFLGDNLAMGRAFLQLYRVTAGREWLARAQGSANFIQQHFAYPVAGFAGGVDDGSPLQPAPNIDENIALARFTNLLFHYSGESRYRAMAEHALSFLARPEIATRRISDPGILLAATEMDQDPLHLTIVGGKKDPAAQAMFATARAYPGWYKRLEWWDEAEGRLPNPDVRYPQLKKAAAFVCTDKLCSLPVFDSESLQAIIGEIWEARINPAAEAP